MARALLLGPGLAAVLAACAAGEPPPAPQPASSRAEPVLETPPHSGTPAPLVPGTTTAPRPSDALGSDRHDRRSAPRDAAVDIHDCSDFTDDEAAQAAFLRAGGPAVDPNDLDRDGDGNACEWEAPEANLPTHPAGSAGPACRQVAGYHRKNGSYVRPHTRCR